MARSALKIYSTPRTSGGGTRYSDAYFRGFTGLNNKYSNIEIADTESPDCLNVVFDALGAIQKRKGYALATSVGSQPIMSVIPFYTQTLNKLLLTFGTSIVQWDPVANTTTTVTNSLHGNGLRFSGAVDTVHNKIYLVNGDTTDGLMSWDGTTFSKVSGAPNGKYVVWYKNHLYIAGDPNAPNRLYMSDLGDPTSWPALNFIDFDEGMGGITGLARLADSLVVFKERDVFLLKGSDPSNYQVVNTYANGHGAVSHWSIVRIPNGLVYLSRDGVYLFDGKKFTLLSDKIQGSINQWNQAQLQNAVAFEYDHKYWLSVPEGVGQQTNNYTYVFSYIYGWWTRFNIAMNACGVFNGATQQPTPYFSDTSGNLFQADTGGSDNGNPINAYFETKSYDFGAPAHKKMFKRVFAFALAQAGNYNLSLTIKQDFGANSKAVTMPLSYSQPSTFGTSIFGRDVFGGMGEITHYTTNVPGMSRYLSFRIEGNGVNAPFTFLGLVVQYLIKEQVI